ncbi:RIO1 family regulatory kinase/ATPase domain-containing protein [Deinococcus cellulosilyticus]|uniref:non-specific serine/threonine protein kinase n=1 Tax=Deinococcus cellulosilyticus (strain DSM 18568 / NBRC 106333 / KACC 11606 / 5516J-15) TaxID=1223518 RepID=A0A511N8M6_DEIC1|nr:RIO1 family regulatory kinase/ATPase [Deinococcus cellulosilyticus]GEM48887.1 serine/threonine protein kinase [Deinococcus cellulosilyticus NBRC 106333 = KACC 11606]
MRYDDYPDTREKFRKNNVRKISSKRRISDLTEHKEKNTSLDKFADPALQELFERGFIQDVIWQLQQGKEATVYVATSEQGLVAVKVYADIRARSFKNDSLYREGRYIGDARIEKAIQDRTNAGINAQLVLWVEQEFMELHSLHHNGIAVPKPIARNANVIIMEFIGTEDGAAPRLSDLHLSKEDARSAFEQAKHILMGFAKLGRVHGDFSTFNLLWHEGKVYAIDFPQMIRFRENPQAEILLRRDIRGLLKTFHKLGIVAEEEALYREVLRQVPR